MIKPIIILFSLILLTSCSQLREVIINENTFDVEIADNPAERAKGLMFKKELKENSGMLFIFPISDKHSFWMKNTLIPLDIIWIDKDQEIVYIHENAQPCRDICNSITPDKDAKYVLEINAGLTKEYNFKVRDKVEII